MAKSYSNLKRDASNEPLMTGTTLLFQDATGTPQTSPLSVPDQSSSVTTITIPTNAAEMEILSNVALRVGSLAALTSNYYVVPANTPKVFMVSGTDTIYIAGDSATATVQFHFNCV